MRRRGRRGPNTSESTGKVGQELPQLGGNQPAPLRPSYPDDAHSADGDNVAGHDDEATENGTTVEADATAQAGAGTGRRRRRRRRGGSSRNALATGGTPRPAPDAAADFDAEAGIGADDEDADNDGAPDPLAGRMEHETQPTEVGTPPEAAPSVAPRAPKGFVVLAIGLPGSGKTTWFKRRGVLPLSSDMLRSILFDDITEQRYQGLVFSTLRSLLRARLVARMPWNYVDATNLSPHERRQWIKMAKSFGYDVQAVFFDVPLEVCLERNQKRERRVSEEILQQMAQRLRPPHFREGFSKITMVRVKPKDGATAEQPAETAEAAE